MLGSSIDLNTIGKMIVFGVGKKIVHLSIKSTLGVQRTDTRRKTEPRLVYLDEGRDPGEGEGGRETPPRVGVEGLKPDKTSKPPQPRWLVGLEHNAYISENLAILDQTIG